MVVIIILALVLIGLFTYHVDKLGKENSILKGQIETLVREQAVGNAETRVGFESQVESLLAKIQEQDLEANDLKYQLEEEKKRNDLVVSQRKSSECRTGNILETMTPILKLFDNHNLKEIRWLGSPIDLISFNFSEEPSITFIEVKTGKSKENKRQKLIKNIIKSGKVYYEQLRIDENGIKSKVEENVE